MHINKVSNVSSLCLMLCALFCFVLLFDADEQPKILQSDKDMVRDHILVFVVQVPTLLRYNHWLFYCFIDYHLPFGIYVHVYMFDS